MKVLKFYADWCGPCKTMGPIVEEVCNDLGIETKSINVDDKELQENQQYPIRGVPTVYLLDDKGETVDVLIGGKSKPVFEEWLKNNLPIKQ